MVVIVPTYRRVITLRDREPCSIGLVTYTAKGFYEQYRKITTYQKVPFQKQTNEGEKAQDARMVVITSGREAKQMNEDERAQDARTVIKASGREAK